MSSGTTPAFPCLHCRRSFHSVDARRMHVTRDHVDVHLNRRHRLRWCTTCNIWVERDGTHSLSRLHTTSTASSAVGSQQHEEEEHSYEEQEDDEDDGDQLQASQREPSRRRNVNSGLWTLLLRGESAEGYGRILLLPAAGMPRSGSMPEKFGVEGDVRFLSLAVHLDVRGGDSK